MLEHFYTSSFLYYLTNYDLLAMAIILGEWAGFVMIAYFVMDNSPWYLSFFLVPMFCGAWVILYEFMTFDLVYKLGYLKGVSL
jgi:hypothetical protein